MHSFCSTTPLKIATSLKWLIKTIILLKTLPVVFHQKSYQRSRWVAKIQDGSSNLLKAWIRIKKFNLIWSQTGFAKQPNPFSGFQNDTKTVAWIKLCFFGRGWTIHYIHLTLKISMEMEDALLWKKMSFGCIVSSSFFFHSGIYMHWHSTKNQNLNFKLLTWAGAKKRFSQQQEYLFRCKIRHLREKPSDYFKVLYVIPFRDISSDLTYLRQVEQMWLCPNIRLFEQFLENEDDCSSNLRTTCMVW